MNIDFNIGLQLDAVKGLILGVMIAICAVILFAIAHGKKEWKAGKPLMKLYMTRLIHYFTFFTSSFYLLIFHQKYDLAYLIFFLILYLHWKVGQNECILSYYEKKWLDPGYILGSNPTSHPFMDMMYPRWVTRAKAGLLFLTCGLVIIRVILVYAS